MHFLVRKLPPLSVAFDEAPPSVPANGPETWTAGNPTPNEPHRLTEADSRR
jgi:hypothetical protein